MLISGNALMVIKLNALVLVKLLDPTQKLSRISVTGGINVRN
jgi:hypothetical protein